MTWSTVHFGKHKGKTLPQILCSDPDWFFWAADQEVFKGNGALESETEDLLRKAKNIKIPNNDDGALNVEYVVHRPTEKFSHFDVVRADKPAHEGSSRTFRSPAIDMSVPRQIAQYDKLGCKRLLKSLKVHVFGSKTARLTKKKCEEFFDDPTNFG